MKIGFWETEKWEEEYLRSKLLDHELCFFENVLDIDHLPEQKDFEVLSVFTGCKINKDTLDQFPNVKLIATRSTGFDHIDLKETQARNILVASVPSYGENTVAEFAFGLLLDLTRKITQSWDSVRKTSSFNIDGLQGMDLMGKTIGIIGTGKIGQHMIKIANGFEMKVLGFDAFPKPDLEKQLNFKYVSLEELLKNSDVISLHVPYLPSTHHLINQTNYQQIKKGAILINTARGAVLETEALVKALDEGILKGAGLDVLEEETCFKDEADYLLKGRMNQENLKTIVENHILMDRENVIITPHNAFNTKEAVVRILDTTIENIQGFLSGQLKNVVKEAQASAPLLTPTPLSTIS